MVTDVTYKVTFRSASRQVLWSQ